MRKERKAPEVYDLNKLVDSTLKSIQMTDKTVTLVFERCSELITLKVEADITGYEGEHTLEITRICNYEIPCTLHTS